MEMTPVSQRNSGFARRPNEDYPTPFWAAAALAYRLRRRARRVWEPAAGDSGLARSLEALGFETIATADDFLGYAAPPLERVEAIATNPPYGSDRKCKVACAFIRYALELDVRIVAMLLKVDFDSGKTRVGLLRENPRFAGKIALLDRIEWFPGSNRSSDNHAWFVWDREHRGAPRIAYAGKSTTARREKAT
jgi:hypothetical protein